MTSVAQQLEQFRLRRARPQPDLSISTVIQSVADTADRSHKKLGEMIELWEQLVPAPIAAHTSLSSLRGGVLHVVVNSSSVLFELDRLLRESLTKQLRQQFRGTLVRVKTRVGKIEADTSKRETDRQPTRARLRD